MKHGDWDIRDIYPCAIIIQICGYLPRSTDSMDYFKFDIPLNAVIYSRIRAN